MPVIVSEFERAMRNAGSGHLFKPHYVPRINWVNCMIQWGANGITFSKDKPPYESAFFEAFFKWKERQHLNKWEFVRGEGETIDDAEIDCRLNLVFLFNKKFPDAFKREDEKE